MIWGIDLGGTRIKHVTMATDGRVIDRRMIETSDGEFREGLPLFAWRIREMLQTSPEPPVAIGLSAPGLVDADGLRIRCMPGRMNGLVDLDWSTFLEYAGKFQVMNDGHAALLGEWKAGSALGLEHACLITLGTGVGGAILSGGKILRGFLGRAGHVGHISLDQSGAPGITGVPGSLEDAIGNHNIRERSGGRFSSTCDLLEAVLAGDDQAKRVWTASVRALACGIVSLINVIDPEKVIVGGGIAEAGPLLFETLAPYLEQWEWRPKGSSVPVIPAALGEWSGAIGAAWNVREDG
jgi:glucokinase